MRTLLTCGAEESVEHFGVEITHHVYLRDAHFKDMRLMSMLAHLRVGGEYKVKSTFKHRIKSRMFLCPTTKIQ